MLVTDVCPFTRLYRQLLQLTNLPLQPFALQQYAFCICFEFFELSSKISRQTLESMNSAASKSFEQFKKVG